MTGVAAAVVLLGLFAAVYLALFFRSLRRDPEVLAVRRANKIVTPGIANAGVNERHGLTPCAATPGAVADSAPARGSGRGTFAYFSTRSLPGSERGLSSPDTTTAPVRGRDDRLDDADPGLSWRAS